LHELSVKTAIIDMMIIDFSFLIVLYIYETVF